MIASAFSMIRLPSFFSMVMRGDKRLAGTAGNPMRAKATDLGSNKPKLGSIHLALAWSATYPCKGSAGGAYLNGSTRKRCCGKCSPPDPATSAL